jgi:hypothetical protein
MYWPCLPQKRLSASEAAPVECAWGSVSSRIVEHRGQGSTHMRGNVRARRIGFAALRTTAASYPPFQVLTLDAPYAVLYVPAQLKTFNKPSPAYSVAHDNGGAHFTA